MIRNSRGSTPQVMTTKLEMSGHGMTTAIDQGIKERPAEVE